MRNALFNITLLASVFVGCVSAVSAADTALTDRYDDTFRKYSQRFFGPGYDWREFKAQAMAESNIDMNAKSWVGARGIMQLMPSTFKEVHTKNPDIGSIDKPEWNIAAGIFYDRKLFLQWNDQIHDGCESFMFGSYNAGRGTLLRAQDVARKRVLDPDLWGSIRTVAPDVPRWRHEETINYVDRINNNLKRMDGQGRVLK
jgi:membrane-bound lytic murein transglycosylase F